MEKLWRFGGGTRKATGNASSISGTTPARQHLAKGRVWMRRSGYQTVSGLVFGGISLVPGIRAVRQWPVEIGTTSIPVWVSWVAVVVAGGLCLWAFRSSAESPDVA